MERIYVVEIAKGNFQSPRCPVRMIRHVFSTPEKRDAFFEPIRLYLDRIGIDYWMWDAPVDKYAGTKKS